MKRNMIEERLRRSVSNISPPPLSEAALNACVPSASRPQPRLLTHRLTAIAAALALTVALGITAFYLLTPPAAVPTAPQCTTVVSLDVNPSLSIDIDEQETVIAVTPLNDDGVHILGDTACDGLSVDDAVSLLVASMVRHGYLNDVANSVLITVNNESSDYALRLQERLASDVLTRIRNEQLDGAVISQHITDDRELRRVAEDKHISVGKAQLIQSILDADPLKDFDELAALSIHELNFVASHAAVPSVKQTGEASNKGYIGKQRAVELALGHLSLTDGDVRRTEAELDYERGTMCYEVELETATAEYELLLDAVTGAVLETEEEPHHAEKDKPRPADRDDRQEDPVGNRTTRPDRPSESTAATTESTAATTVTTKVTSTTATTNATATAATGKVTTAATTTTTKVTSTTVAPDHAPPSKEEPGVGNDHETDRILTAEEALRIACDHAAVDIRSIRAETELKRQDGHAVYEIEFTFRRTEYDFKIDAVSGEILKYSAEADD